MKAPARLSQSIWWPLAVFLVFTAAVVWAGSAFFERLKQEQKTATAGTLTSVGKLKAEQIRFYFDRNQKFALSVARLLGQGELPHWLRDGAPAMPEALRESLLLVLRNRGENTLLILAPDASIRFSAGQFTQLTEEGRRLALRAMTEPPPITSDIYRGDPSAPEQALLDIFVPIQSTDGDHAVGVLVLRDDLAYLYGLIQTWPAESPTAESVLVRLEGDHALFLNELRFRKQTALRTQVPLSAGQNFPGWPSTAAAQGQVGIWEARDYRDHAILAYTLPVAGPVPGWGMVVKMDLVEVLAPVQRLKNVTLGVTTAFILSALLALGAWLRQLQAKARQESAERERIAQLNEQLEQRVRDRTAELDRAAEEIRMLNTDLERRVEERTAELDRFFTLSLDLLCISSADGYFKRISLAFTQTLGWSVEEILAQPFLDFVHPDDRAATLREVERQVVAGEKVLQFENRYRHKDGSWRVLSWNSAPQPGGMMYAVARDITERKEAEEQIAQLNADLQHRAVQFEAANKDLESFSYSVSHDLRAPLRHVQGYVELLTEATDGQLPPEAREYLKVISDASGEMGQLIDDLLAFSRMGRTEMHGDSVRLDELVQESIRGLELATRDRHIVWKIAPLPAVLGDRPMLRQVFANLVGNAVKYSRPRDPAEIEIGCAGEEDGWIIFFVRDNGVGFSMKYVHKLFGVFQRLHKASEFEGTGIGLAIVQRIIHRHGGRVWAEGTPNLGSTFCFTLKPAPAQQSGTERNQNL